MNDMNTHSPLLDLLTKLDDSCFAYDVLEEIFEIKHFKSLICTCKKLSDNGALMESWAKVLFKHFHEQLSEDFSRVSTLDKHFYKRILSYKIAESNFFHQAPKSLNKSDLLNLEKRYKEYEIIRSTIRKIFSDTDRFYHPEIGLPYDSLFTNDIIKRNMNVGKIIFEIATAADMFWLFFLGCVSIGKYANLFGLLGLVALFFIMEFFPSYWEQYKTTQLFHPPVKIFNLMETSIKEVIQLQFKDDSEVYYKYA